jgi:hypothetical protein
MDFFELFAECSIAFAGFGAVHAVLRGSTGARGVYRAWFVVTQGALSFLLSILPLLLALTSLSDAPLWRIASGVGVVLTGAGTYTYISFDLRLKQIGKPPQVITSLRLGQTLNILTVLAMLANLLGLFGPPGPLLYAMALVFLLTAGVNALLASFLLPLRHELEGEDSSTSGDSDAG